jgi:anti-sigma factor RsiW
MKLEKRKNPADHLTDDTLFALALPAAGVPEALPAHLLECLRCTRALADWKKAVRDLGERDEDDLEKRTAEEWSAVEDSTLAAIRREGAPGRGRARTLSWALPAAASLLVFALLVSGRQNSAPEAAGDTAGLSAQDQADDALLRDVDRLASGEESPGGWGALAPDPGIPDVPQPEGRS